MKNIKVAIDDTVYLEIVFKLDTDRLISLPNGHNIRFYSWDYTTGYVLYPVREKTFGKKL